MDQVLATSGEQLPCVTLADGTAAIRLVMASSASDTVALARPGLTDLPYRLLIERVLEARGFKIEFNRQTPEAAIATIVDQLIGPGSFPDERAALAADITALAETMAELGGGRPMISVRTYFAPGDLVWHVDRFGAREAFRLVWPIGRPAGMQVTPTDNIDLATYRGFMRREFPLLCRLDGVVARSGAPVEQIWAHRPEQLAAMKDGAFTFIRDPARIAQVPPGAASIHRVETPTTPGTFHRSSWANRHQPGFQIVITVAGE